MDKHTKTLADYLDFVKRRKYYIVVTWLLASLVSVIIAYNLPKVYRSTATLLIEAPIPTKLFESTASRYAAEQIQSIYQRVMMTDNVLSIIDATGLYSGFRNGYTKYELANLFRDSTEVGLTTSSLTPRNESRMAEVAFYISFSHGEPAKAQEVAGKLAALLIEQNDKARTQRATNVAEFLMEESAKLNRELQEIDNRIANYKEQNNFSLPEQVQGNLAAIDRAESELRDTDNQIRATKERIAFLSAELARAQQELPGKSDDKAPKSRAETLRILRAQYLRYSSLYSPSHPSVVRLKREIKGLDPAFEGQLAHEDVKKQLAEARRELELLEEMYADNHPDIVKRRKQIDRLEQRLKNTQPHSRQEQEAVAMNAINPAYLGVQAQYKSSQSELQSLMQKQDYLKAKLEKLHTILAMAPQVEMEYTNLIRERDNTMKKYTQLKEKWLDAKLAQTLEVQQQGQTLTLIEPPAIPARPEQVSRRKVVIGGSFMGIIAGLGIAFLLEFLEPGIRGYRAISEVTGLMPLVVVPYIESPAEVGERLAKQNRMRKVVVRTGIAFIMLVAIAMYVLFFPLNTAMNQTQGHSNGNNHALIGE